MKQILILSSVVFVNSFAPAAAGGFALEQQDANAIGAAYAGAQARFGDAGFAYHNPAAIFGTGSFQASFSIAALIPDTRYDNASAALLDAFPVAGRTQDDGALENAAVPNFSAAFRLTDRVSAGLTINAPFGLNSKYAADSVIRYHALETDAKVVSIAPMAAIEPYHGLVIGAAVRIQVLDLEASTAIDAAGMALASGLPGFMPGTSDVFVALDGDDVDMGFAVGAQAQLHDRLRIGASYASKITHDLSGGANFDLSASAAGQLINAMTGMFETTTFTSEFVTPASASIGAIFEASDALDLMASAVFTRWSDFEGLTTTFANPAQPPDVFTQDWKDVWAFSAGGEYKLTRSARVRAGFMFEDSPVNDAFASPRIPDADRYWINAGVSYDINDRLAVDGGLGIAILEKRRINLSSAAPENMSRGDLTATFDTTGFVAALRLQYRLR
ncbi:MAG: OmpP1/FadL family transporter [Parvularculaceae bacterium]